MRRCELRRKDRLACRGTPRGISRWLRRDREPPVWRPRDARCAPRSGARARMVCRRGRAYARSAPSSGQGQAPSSGGQPRASQHRRTRMVDQERRSGDHGPRDGGARRARRRQPTGCHLGGRATVQRSMDLADERPGRVAGRNIGRGPGRDVRITLERSQYAGFPDASMAVHTATVS